jgi:hypothetical protein
MNGSMQGGNIGWTLVGLGLLIVAGGLLWLFVPGVSRLGRLPGDIVIEGKNGRFYFPVVTCIVLSIVLSLVMWIVSRLTGGN